MVQQAATSPPVEPRPQAQAAAEVPDAEAAERVARVQGFFQTLFKAFKTIALHRHAEQQYGDFLEPAHQSLTAFLEDHKSLNLGVEQLGFTHAGQTVHEEEASDQNLAFRFYRDGIRMLVLHRGLTADELLAFVLICLDTQRRQGFLGEDLTSRLWQAELEHIEYVAVESYSLGDETTEQTRAEVDKIVNYLYQRLTTTGGDTMSFAKLSLNDLDAKLENVEQAIGLSIKEDSATEELKAQVQADLEHDASQRLMARLPDVLLDMYYLPMDEELEQAVLNGFVQLLDSYLMREDFDGVDRLFTTYRSLGQRTIPAANHAVLQRIFAAVRDKMREDATIDKLGQILERTRDEAKRRRLQQYLRHMGPGAIGALLRTLEGLTAIDARRQICDILAELGADDLDVFVAKLRSPKANLVRDMLYVLDRLDPPDKMEHVAGLLSHPNLALRIEALKTIGSSPDAETGAFLLKSLSDDDAQVRVTAATLLADNHPGLAWKPLLAMVQEADFGDRPQREQVSLLAALVTTQSPEALDYLSEQLRQTALVGKKKLLEQQKTILNAMIASGSQQALQLLGKEIETGFKSRELSAAAQRAHQRLQDRLRSAAAEQAS